MGIFDSFFEEDGKKVIPSVVHKAAPSMITPQPTELSKFVSHFEELFKRQNLPGPDYFEFWKMLNAMPGQREDNAVICFAGLNAMGLPKDLLLSTAQHYLKAMNDDRVAFLQAIADKVKNEVGTKKDKIKAIQLENDQKRTMIQKLQGELDESVNVVSSLESEIFSETAKIEVNKASYEGACNAMIQKVTDDISTIKNKIQ